MPEETIDPTLPDVSIKLAGTTYKLVFSFEALAIAEQKLKDAGHPINIFHALDFENLSAVQLTALLYAGLVTYAPDVDLAAITKGLSLRKTIEVKQKLFDAFVLSMVDVEDLAPDPLAVAAK